MRRRTWAVITATTALASVGVLVVPATSSAEPPIPTIRTLNVLPTVVAERGAGQRLMHLTLGTYVAAVGGPLELLAEKTADRQLDLTQVHREADGTTTVLRQLPTDPLARFEYGIAKFFRLRWIKNGTMVRQQSAPFCPSPWSASRLDDSGPSNPTYPATCGTGTPLTRATVWGIDRGWAVRAINGPVVNPRIPDGTYTLELTVAEPWASALGMTENAPATTAVRLRTVDHGCPPPCVEEHTAHATAEPRGDFVPASVPAGPLPDLVPLPAFEPMVERVAKREFLAFAANVWNAGAGPLLVEGFRSSDVSEMTATQYFVEGDEVIGKEEVGTFDYDDRFNHKHWHFEDFAVYDLVPEDGGGPVRSGKQSFCLAPTDPIDLTIPGASWETDQADLDSACGGTDSIWIRESLPSGWGDTYYQSRAGQAFRITGLPNGIYTIRVTTNFEENLYETDYSNNVSELRIRLRGEPGKRSVRVL